MSGGVRNLRAMFENKEESSISPPDRGRSPAGSIGGGGSNGTSPRPLSKVRTSFVAVERSGQLGTQWGLRKESNPDPSLATRRDGFSTDETADSKALADRKQSINSEISARKSSAAVTETIPETAVESPPVESEKKSGYVNGNTGRGKVATAASKPGANSDKMSAVEDRNSKPISGDTTSNAAISGGVAMNSAGANGKVKSIPATKDTAKTVPTGRAAKPVPISTAPSSAPTKAAPKSTKSPAAPKTPTTPGKAPTTLGKSSKAPNSKPVASSISAAQTKPGDMKITKLTTSSTTSKPSAQPTASSTVATSENKPPQASPSTGFHKPKPRSPTRPAKLPASMTAPTASSLSKASTGAVSSRQSLAPSTKTISRSPSHASLSREQELRRKTSRIDVDKAALSKPTGSTLKKQPSRQSLPKQTVPADEGFLARMMRPTTSSASKTTEKIVTPPRAKPSTRPTTREGPGSHKLHHGLRGSPSANKLPLAPNEAKKEDSTTAHVDEMEDHAAAAGGSNQAELAGSAEAESMIPASSEGDLAAVSSTENQSAEEKTTGNESTVEAEPANANEIAADVDQNVEQLVTTGEATPNIEAAKSVDTEPSAVIAEEPENPASKFIELADKSEEPIVSEEPKITVPEVGVSGAHSIARGVSESREEESKTENTVTAA